MFRRTRPNTESARSDALDRDIRLLDENGSPYGVKQVSNKMRTSSMSYLYDIAEGNVEDHEAVYVFGHNSAVGTSLEVISDISATQPYLTSAETLSVVSNDAKDGAGLDGARTVTITGLDGDYEQISETVTLTAAGTVKTTLSFLRVFSAYVATAGADGVNAGIIDIKNNAASSTLLLIPAGEGQTNAAVYTVPADHTFYMVHGWGSENSSKGSEIHFFIRLFGTGAWRGLYNIAILDNVFDFQFILPPSFPEKTDIMLRAISALGAANVSAGFEGWIEQ